MSILQYLETISFELDLTVKIQGLKGINWYLIPPLVSLLVRILEEIQIGFDWSAGEFDFLILAGCEAGGEIPKTGQQWEECKKCEESSRGPREGEDVRQENGNRSDKGE